MARNTTFDRQIAQLVEGHISELVTALTRAVRDNLADEIRLYVSTSGNDRILSPTLIRVRGKRRPRDLSCIAPGCKNKSKGPRFKYLCEKHLDTPKRQIEQWRQAKAEERKQMYL